MQAAPRPSPAMPHGPVTELARRLARRVLPRAVRNVLRAPGRAVWWASTEVRHRLGFDERVRIRDGFDLRSHPAAFPLAYHAQLDDPEQVLEFDGFIAACRPEMLLFDLGAHFGLFSLAAAHYGGAGARAVAVDASPVAATMLRAQVALNALADRVVVECAAVGRADGWTEMVATGVHGAGYFVASDADHPAGERTRTPVVTIDTLARRHGRPTHVKIDVEGFEADALRGGEATFTGARRPVVFVELHHEMIARRGGDPAEALRLLRAYGYDPRDLHGAPLDDAAVLQRPLTRIVAVPAGARGNAPGSRE